MDTDPHLAIVLTDVAMATSSGPPPRTRSA